MANLRNLSNEQLSLAGSTNQILYETSNKDKEVMKLYLPGYLSLKFNSINEVSHENMNAEVHCQIKFILNVRQFQMDKGIIDYLRSNVILFFNTNEAIKLTEDDEQEEIYIDEQYEKQKDELVHHYLIYTINRTFITSMITQNIIWTPFDLLDLTLSISPKIKGFYQINDQIKEKKYQRPIFVPNKIAKMSFMINLMDCPKCKSNTIRYDAHFDFGTYTAATAKLRVEYTNEDSSQIIQDRSAQINQANEKVTKEAADYSSIQQFQIAHFFIVLFKNPTSSVSTIFVPLILLSVINLGIYAQQANLAGRIENLAALMFAFVAIMPTIRDQIPPSPSLTITQIHVFLLLSTTLLCLIESIIKGDSSEAISPINDPFFIISLLISIYVFVGIVVMMILHFRFWKINYMEIAEEKTQFNHKNWKNQECDKHFMKFFDSNCIAGLSTLISKFRRQGKK